MEEKATETFAEAAPDELSGDWIRDQLKDAPEVIPHSQPADQQQIAELSSSAAKEEGRAAESVTVLASALLDATAKPLQALEQDWSAQLAALQSRVNERLDAVEQVTTNVAHFEVAIDVVREDLRGTDSRAQRAESQTKNCLEQLGSFETAVNGQLQEVIASIEQIRKDMAAQEKILDELRHAEERRTQAVKRLAKIFSGVQDTVGLLASDNQRPSPSEPPSG